jgi:hypothetical protein
LMFETWPNFKEKLKKTLKLWRRRVELIFYWSR